MRKILNNRLKLSGWQRIWVVLTVICWVIILTSSISEFPTHFRDTKIEYVLDKIDSEDKKYILDAAKYKTYDMEKASESYDKDTLEIGDYRLYLLISVPSNLIRPLNPEDEEVGQVKMEARGMLIKNASMDEVSNFIISKGFTVEQIRSVRLDYSKVDEMKQSIEKNFIKALPSALFKTQLMHICFTVLMMVILPSIIYLLGWTIGWIYRGFKQA